MKNYKRSHIRKILMKEFAEILKEQDKKEFSKIEMNDQQTFTDPSVFDDNQTIMDQFTMLIQIVDTLYENQLRFNERFKIIEEVTENLKSSNASGTSRVTVEK